MITQSTTRNLGRTLLVLALVTVLSSAMAQTTPQTMPQVEANPLIPAQVLVPAAQQVAPTLSGQTTQASGTPSAQPAPSPSAATSKPSVPDSAKLMMPYSVPPAGPGIFQGSDQTFREISYLTAERDLIEARTQREQALQKQAEAHAKLAEMLSSPTSGQPGAKSAQPTPEQQAAQAQAKALEQAWKIANTPYVNSVYMYGDKAYAEIVIGSTWTMASKGTVLTTGERVVDISPGGVVLAGKKGRRTLSVRGSASVD